MKTALSTLELRRAHTLDDALAIMRAEHRVPIAGATDVYVGLNFGTVPGDHSATATMGLVELNAARMVNLVPAVVEANPGVRSFAELPIVTALR